MRLSLNSILAALALFSVLSANAATLSVSDSENVDTITGATFTFSQFDTALGALSAIDLIINSSTPTGSASVTNNSPTNNVTIRYIRSAIDIYDLTSTLGFTDFNGSTFDLDTTPTAKSPTTFIMAPSTSQVFSVNGGQSLIGGSAQTFSINPLAFAAYQGSGTVSFTGYTSLNLNTIGATYTVDSSLYTAATSLTLRYTYTPSSPVPEPGQVAASVLLLGGIGAYVFIKRRRKSAAAVA